MKRLTSVILMMILFASIVGCSNKNINEDAAEFLEQTDGIEDTTSPTTVETSEVNEDNGSDNAEPGNINEEDKDNEENDVSQTTIRIGIPEGMEVLSALSLLKESENDDVEFEIIKRSKVFSANDLSDEYNVLILPTHTAAALYNRTTEFKLIGTSVWSSAHLVTNSDITSWMEMKGESISLMGQGQPTDIILRSLLVKNSLEPDQDITLNYISDAKALQSSVTKNTKLAVLSEPQLSTVLGRSQKVEVVYNLSEEWSAEIGGLYGVPQISVLVSDELIENHPVLLDLITRRMFESTHWYSEEAKEVVTFAESLNIGVNRNLIRRQLETLDINFVPVGENREMYDVYFNTLNDYSKRLIGGSVPDEGFYFIPPRRP